MDKLKPEVKAWAYDSDVWKKAIEPYIKEECNELKQILCICPHDEIDEVRGNLNALEGMRSDFRKAYEDAKTLTQIQEDTKNDAETDR